MKECHQSVVLLEQGLGQKWNVVQRWLRKLGVVGWMVVEDRPRVGGAIRELDSCSSVFDEDTEILCA